MTHQALEAPMPLSHAAPESGAITFRVVRGAAGLRSLQAGWDALVRAMERPDFYHRYEWHECYAESWPAQAADLYFLVAERGDEPVAIFPLQLSVSRGLRTLAPPDPNYLTYSDLVGGQGPESEGILTALLEALRSTRAVRWDKLELPKLLEGSVAARSLAHHAPRGLLTHGRGKCYSFRCDQPFDQLSKQFPKSFRTLLRRRRRQLSELGAVEFVSSRDPRALPDLFDEFLRLEASGWKGESGERSAILCDPVLLDFYRRLLERFGASASCEVNLLRLDGRTIAGQFCLLSGGTWYHLKIAYDEELGKFSPGNVLLENVVERLCGDEGIHTASLLTGAEWAERWRPDGREVTRLVASSGSLGGGLLLREARVRRLLREQVVPRLERLRHPPAATPEPES